jgi:hypothetical protein
MLAALLPLALSAEITSAAPPAGTPYPADPFAAEYRIPARRDVGAAAGQFRVMGSGLLALGRDGLDAGGTGTLELMTFAYVGVRASSEALFLGAGNPSLWAARVGPSLHLLPYSRVDLSGYLEAGVAGLGLFGSNATAAPMLSPGGCIDVWLDSLFFLHLDGHLDWAVYSLADQAHAYLRLVGGAGLGLGF